MTHINFSKEQRGVTVIELLIGIAVMGILVTLVTSGFRAFHEMQQLSSAREQVISFVRQAREQTLAATNNMPYGVHFEQTRLVLFSGDSYATSSPDNEVLHLDNAVEVYDITFSGANVRFRRLTGEAEESGAVSLRLKNGSASTTIYIKTNGLIYAE